MNTSKLDKSKLNAMEVEKVIQHYIPGYYSSEANMTIPVSKLREIIQGSYSLGYSRDIIKLGEKE